MKSVLIILLLSLFSLNYLWGQSSSGLIPIETFGSEHYKAQPITWAFAEDSRGLMYVGSKEALLVYSGSWKKYHIDSHNDVTSIAMGGNGEIFVGGRGEFGYFGADPTNTGSLHYFPLYQKLDSIQKQSIGTIWYTIVNKNSVYFISAEKTYHYQIIQKTLKIIDHPAEVIHAAKVHHQILVIVKDKGLFKLDEKGLSSFGKKGHFMTLKEDKEKANIKYFCESSGSKVLFINANYQLMEFDISNPNLPPIHFKTNVDSLLKNASVLKIIKLGDAYFGLYLPGNGILILDKNGKFIRKIDKSTGLKQDIVENLYFDSQQNLWAAHGTGISRIEIYSNYEYFPREWLNLKDRVHKITRFNNILYLACKDGLYQYTNPRFSPDSLLVQNPKPQVTKAPFPHTSHTAIWDIYPVEVEGKALMLIITDDFVFSLNDKNHIDTVLYSSGNTLMQDKIDPNRIWIGLYPKGLGSFYYTQGKWVNEGQIQGSNYEIFKLDFDSDLNLWLGRIDGLSVLYKPSFRNNTIFQAKLRNFSAKDGLPVNDAIFPLFMDGRMVFGSSEGIFIYDSKKEKFQIDSQLPSWFASHHVHRMYTDNSQRTWTVTYNYDHSVIFLRSFQKTTSGNYINRIPLALEVNAQAFDALYQDGQSLWAGGSFDLIKINNVGESGKSSTVKAFLNRISIAGRSTLFDGHFYDDQFKAIDQQNQNAIPILEYAKNNLSFHFSGISSKVKAKISYRWKLEGYDTDWGPWVTNTEVQFTNLPEGEYNFRLKARDSYGNLSNEVNYAFSIKPPWYRTLVAYIGYLLFFIAFVWGAIRVSTRSLKKIIKAATAEIVAQKEDIEEKTLNIISSINYAKRIQEAVIPQKKLMQKVFPKHFVLWKPRDIVSGDFYWMMQKGEKAIIAAADCTGHGVPGAFMSIMGISFLNEIANNKEVQTAAEALNQLRHNVIVSLNQEGSETDTKDGMDISLCVFDFKKMMMQFSGAYNPLYMIRDGELSVIKADRMPIGVHERDNKPFSNMEFSLHKGDLFYILSDGYIDQFGGPDGKKFMTGKFKQLLLEIYKLPMEEQKEVLWQTILDWRGEIEQVDDIIIIGIQVP